mmetsp:Transcript_2987/g.14056  ORF Transcript_2987/g.14056 Transcript_2987/m.14056 type:complete len:212 (-) Transcript_2987:835-1470(-)
MMSVQQQQSADGGCQKYGVVEVLVKGKLQVVRAHGFVDEPPVPVRQRVPYEQHRGQKVQALHLSHEQHQERGGSTAAAAHREEEPVQRVHKVSHRVGHQKPDEQQRQVLAQHLGIDVVHLGLARDEHRERGGDRVRPELPFEHEVVQSGHHPPRAHSRHRHPRRVFNLAPRGSRLHRPFPRRPDLVQLGEQRPAHLLHGLNLRLEQRQPRD